MNLRRLFCPLLGFLGACSADGTRRETLRLAVREAISRVDPAQLEEDVRALCRHGPRALDTPAATEAAIDYLRGELEAAGYEVRLEEIHDDPPKWPAVKDSYQVNLVAELRGHDEPERFIEVGAHYDTVPGSPGADDNGSAVAGVLGCARALAGLETRRSVRFVLFCLEEYGKGGSFQHVEASLARGDRLEAALILEMIGYASDEPGSQQTPLRIPLLLSPPREGNFILVVGNFRSGSLGNRFERALKRYVPELPLFSVNRLGGFFPDATRSDHEAYWKQKIPAVMITDSANFRNPHYHQPSDRPETLNYDFLAKVTKATAATLITWAGVVED